MASLEKKVKSLPLEPGVYLFLGVANEEMGWTDYVHTPTFRPDEAAIVTGVTAAASLVADFNAAGAARD